MNFGSAARSWLASHTGISARDLKLSPMAGAASSAVYLVQDGCNKVGERFVLRVIENAEWAAREPDLAEHETAALREAARAGLPAPNGVAYGAPAETGLPGPAVLMSHLPGRVQLQPTNRAHWLRALARQLAVIHSHPATGFSWRFESWVDRAAVRPPVWTSRPDAWERAIEIVLAPAPPHPPVFLHRDYHPANVLWNGEEGAEQVSGVVDWVNACLGPAGADVAHCRCNLALMFGNEAADAFLDEYCREVPAFSYDPYWDLDGILDMFLPEPEWYAPWGEFGMARAPQELLRQRVEAFLCRVLAGV